MLPKDDAGLIRERRAACKRLATCRRLVSAAARRSGRCGRWRSCGPFSSRFCAQNRARHYISLADSIFL